MSLPFYDVWGGGGGEEGKGGVGQPTVFKM